MRERAIRLVMEQHPVHPSEWAALQELVVARVELGLTHQEIADAFDKPSANAARMAVQRAMLRLPAHMKVTAPDPNVQAALGALSDDAQFDWEAPTTTEPGARGTLDKLRVLAAVAHACRDDHASAACPARASLPMGLARRGRSTRARRLR